MKVMKRALRPSSLALIIAAAGLLPLASHAQGTSMSDIEARYKEEIQRCQSLTDPEDQRTCRREAGAALQEARRNRLNEPVNPGNASARCQRLPADQRADCERLMSDSSAVTHGSVSGGGVLRELTITVPADGAAATGTYGSQPAPATGTGGSSGGYGTSAPAGGYGTQTPGSYQGPAPGAYGTQPMRTQ